MVTSANIVKDVQKYTKFQYQLGKCFLIFLSVYIYTYICLGIKKSVPMQ